MRICLDTSIGEPWHRRVQRPALRHLTDQQLQQAIAVALRIIDTPSLLPELNTRSIAQRKKITAADQLKGSLQKRMMSI